MRIGATGVGEGTRDFSKVVSRGTDVTYTNPATRREDAVRRLATRRPRVEGGVPHSPRFRASVVNQKMRPRQSRVREMDMLCGYFFKDTAMLDMRKLLDDNAGVTTTLFAEHVNPPMAKVLKLLGFDVNYVRGRGQYLWDDQGRKYIDCLAGYGTFGLGRNHPVVRDALKQLMDMDLPNLVKMGLPKLSGLLAKELLKVTPGDYQRVFFINSGAEAVESAIKFARAATNRSRIIYCDHAFHGLTYGALSMNGGDDFRKGFGTLPPDVTVIAMNDLPALEAELKKGDVAAFFVEPIQGKGVHIPNDDFLPGAVELCHRHGALFVADEVQTGLGRTGKMFAFEHWGIEPDIICIAKSLSGGFVPVGAVITRQWIHEKTFSRLDRCMVHSSTFGQNDMAMAAGIAAMHVLREEKIVENAAAMGELLKSKLAQMIGRHELVKDVRGKGLMIGIEFGQPKSLTLKMAWKMIHAVDGGLFPQAVIIPMLADHQVLAQVAGNHMGIIKLIPPLVINAEDVEKIASSFDDVIARCHKFPGPTWEIAKRLSTHAMRKAQ
ncbi:MAG: aspartate aminotransferase family protein [Phycisphaeraceae bacterium]